MEKHKKNGIIVGIMINLILLSLIISLLQVNHNDATGSTVPYEVVFPEQFEGLALDTAQEAWIEVNYQLLGMNLGNIQEVDQQGYTGSLIRDYRMGSLIYWEISDENTTVCIDAFTKEIVTYSNEDVFTTGSFSYDDLTDDLGDMINQFDTLPQDAEVVPNISLDESAFSTVVISSSSNYTDTYYNQSFWVVKYNRTFYDILTGDYITLWVNMQGHIQFYEKVWNLDFGGLNPNFFTNSMQAEMAATQACDGMVTVLDSYRCVLRPNDYWSNEDILYGGSPTKVWVVIIKEDLIDLRIFFIEDFTEDVVGGDAAYDYWE